MIGLIAGCTAFVLRPGFRKEKREEGRKQSRNETLNEAHEKVTSPLIWKGFFSTTQRLSCLEEMTWFQL